VSVCPLVIDACGYVLPAAELLYERAAGPLRGYWPRLEERLALTAATPGIGDWDSSYTRFVASTDMADAVAGTLPKPARFPRPPRPRPDIETRVLHDNAKGRLRALDRLAIDVQLLHPGHGVDVVMELDSVVAALLLGAYNRYVTTYCEADPRRLKAVLQLHAGEPSWSAEELRELAGDPSVAGITVHFPEGYAPDRPELAPIWEKLAETGLALIHRPSAAIPTAEPAQLLAALRSPAARRSWPAARIAFIGWPRGALAGLAPEVTATDGDRLFVAVENPSEAAPCIGSASPIFCSHFPFEGPEFADFRNGDQHARSALRENALSLLDLMSARRS
jgi:predicted TIM-barrel fold metal-dependent hydrolase